MTFNPAVPLNGDSPAIFPSQNQVNMARLQTIIGADHQFNLTAAADDGYHNVIHLTQQAPTGALAATGRLYCRSNGPNIQLFYMDDSGVENQITPFDFQNPSKVFGSTVLASGATVNIFNVAYAFTGFGTVFVLGTTSQRTYNFLRTGVLTDLNELDNNSGAVSRPTLQFSGTILQAKNNSGSSQTVLWSLMINRV